MGFLSRLFDMINSKLPNETQLFDITVLPSDDELILTLAGNFLDSASRTPVHGNGFDLRITYNRITLAGENATEIAEVARKIRALHDLRAAEGKRYEVTLHNIVVLESDRNTVLGSCASYMGDEPRAGKATYEYIIFDGKDEAAVLADSRRVQELHDLRAAESRTVALEKLAELNL